MHYSYQDLTSIRQDCMGIGDRIKIAGVTVAFFPDEKVLANIATYCEKPHVLYIYDNTGKESESLKSFANKFSHVVYIYNGTNKGIAWCLNDAAKKALESGCTWLLTMDQDSSFSNNSLDSFIGRLNENDHFNTAILSPYHVTRFSRISEGGLKKTKITMTSGNLVNLKIHKDLAGFEEKLFIDGVDWDYCLKAGKCGYDVWIDHDCHLNHQLGAVTFHEILFWRVVVQNYSAIRRYYITRNKLYIFAKHVRSYPILCMRWIVTVLLDWAKILLFEEDKSGKSIAIIKAFRDASIGRFGKLSDG